MTKLEPTASAPSIPKSQRFDWGTMSWIDDPEPECEALPPIPKQEPRFVFDRDALEIQVRCDRHQFAFDLASLTNLESKLKTRPLSEQQGLNCKISDEFMRDFGIEFRDEIEQCGHEVFCGRRDWRSILFSRPVLDIDVFEAARTGATLDWRVGAIRWPKQSALLKHAVPIFDVRDEGDGSDELIQTRYLCRGGSMLITGPTGVGKSSLITQLVFSWGLGRPCLGFEPNGPISTLLIQAENDAGDVIEAREGIVQGLDLGEADEAVLNEMVSVATIDDATGPEFFARVEKLIRYWHPDLIVIDPLLAYVGGDINRQDVAANFLRNHLNPLIHRANAACIIVHHEGKPPRENQKQGPSSPDYSGLGSSDLSNWARAIAALKVEDDAFSLTLGKRGKRAGVADEYGTAKIWLRHADGFIFWQQVEAGSVKSKDRAKTIEDLIALVPDSPARIDKNVLLEKAKAAGIGEKKARAFLSEAIDAQQLHTHFEKRHGTNALCRIARHPMPI